MFTKVSQLEVVGIGLSTVVTKKKMQEFLYEELLLQPHKIGVPYRKFQNQYLTQNLFGVRSFTTTLKEPQSSH